MEGASSTSVATEHQHDHKVPTALDCHICFKPPTDPVATTCGHVFCWSCMLDFFEFDPNEEKCPECGTALNLDLNVLTLYANASDAPSRPPSDTPSQNNIIPGRPRTPLTFIHDCICEGFSWKPHVSGAEKVELMLEVLQGERTNRRGRLKLSKLKAKGTKMLPKWVKELLKLKPATPGEISEREAMMEQEVNDLQQETSALEEELAQQQRVDWELEHQLARRRQARELPPLRLRKKARSEES